MSRIPRGLALAFLTLSMVTLGGMSHTAMASAPDEDPEPVEDPPPVEAPVPLSPMCAQAVECFNQLEMAACDGTGDCGFNAEVPGPDDSSCRDALNRAPELLQPFIALNPELSVPAICQAP